jgi:predicted site-specific integrase-resolvase
MSTEVEIPELADLITISLAAERLEISRQAAHKMTRSGRLKAWRIRSAGEDRPLVVLESEVTELMKKRTKVVTVPTGGVVGAR